MKKTIMLIAGLFIAAPVFAQTFEDTYWVEFDISNNPFLYYVPGGNVGDVLTRTNIGGGVHRWYPQPVSALLTRTVTYPTVTLNTSFQLFSNTLVTYSVDISCTLSLSGGQTGTIFLEIADDSAFTTNVHELSRFVNGNTGTLTIGLNITQSATGTLTGYVPAGKYVRLRTANTAGSPTFNFRSAQEVAGI